MKRIDLTGQTFGMLTVLELSEKRTPQERECGSAAASAAILHTQAQINWYPEKRETAAVKILMRQRADRSLNIRRLRIADHTGQITPVAARCLSRGCARPEANADFIKARERLSASPSFAAWPGIENPGGGLINFIQYIRKEVPCGLERDQNRIPHHGDQLQETCR